MALDDVDDPDLRAYLASLDLEDDGDPEQVEVLSPTSGRGSKYPEELLDGLLETIRADPHYCARYAELISDWTAVRGSLIRCLSRELYELFIETMSVRDIQQGIRDLPSDNLHPDGCGIYLHVIKVAISAHVNKHVRHTSKAKRNSSTNEVNYKTYRYIGQAQNLSNRINNQHLDFRYRRDHPSLHNYVYDRSASDKFVVLATLTENVKRPDLVLNLLEMWCCLLFRYLQPQALQEWEMTSEMANREVSQDIGALNVAIPLDYGDEGRSRKAISYLEGSGDELIKRYYIEARRRRWRRVESEEIVMPLADERGQDSTQKGVFESLGVPVGSEFMIGLCVGLLGTAFWIHRNRLEAIWKSF